MSQRLRIGIESMSKACLALTLDQSRRKIGSPLLMSHWYWTLTERSQRISDSTLSIVCLPLRNWFNADLRTEYTSESVVSARYDISGGLSIGSVSVPNGCRVGGCGRVLTGANGRIGWSADANGEVHSFSICNLVWSTRPDHRLMIVQFIQFHDREEIRRRLASDSDSEDTLLNYGLRSSRKSSLVSRLQSGQSLQICFMNEMVSDSLSNVSSLSSPDVRRHSELVFCCLQAFDGSEPQTNKLDNESRSDNNLDNKCRFSPNNNSCLEISKALDSLGISKSTAKRPNHLFTKLGFSSLDKTELDKSQLFFDIEKPSKREMFAEYHARLHAEARLALAQVT